MTRRDGTGPVGRGPLTGRGFGVCNDAYAAPRIGVGYGRGVRGVGGGRANRLGRRDGTGPMARDLGYESSTSKSHKDLLDEEREILKDRLNRVEEELKDL